MPYIYGVDVLARYVKKALSTSTVSSADMTYFKGSDVSAGSVGGCVWGTRLVSISQERDSASRQFVHD
jgi:hypothetical protein